jgi:hypothetical protein
MILCIIYPVVAKHEAFYCHALQILYLLCRLLFLQHALNSVRLTKSSDDDKPWYETIVHNGIYFARCWGQDAINTAEAVLISACTLSDHNLLCTAPDSLFALITCATAFVLMAKFTTIRRCGAHLEGASDSLLASTINHLSAAALGPEHFPAKCAQLITAWVTKWEQHVNIYGPTTDLEDTPESLEQVQSNTNTINTSQSDQDMVSNTDEFIRLMGPDIYLDTGFWTSFMENISTPNS